MHEKSCTKKISRVRLFCMMREIFFCVLSACRKTELLPIVFLSVFIRHGYVDSNLVFLDSFSSLNVGGVLYAVVRQYLLYHDGRRYIHLFHISLNDRHYAIYRFVTVVYYFEDNAAAFARLYHMVASIVYEAYVVYAQVLYARRSAWRIIPLSRGLIRIIASALAFYWIPVLFILMSFWLRSVVYYSSDGGASYGSYL